MKNEELGSTGIPFVRGGDIQDGVVRTDVTDHIRAELAARIDGKLVQPGDVAFITKGSVGRVGRVLAGQPPFVVAPQVCYWRALDTRQIDPTFLYYLLIGSEFQNQLDAVKTHGSMVADYVSLSDQREFRLTFPPIQAQQAVASVLGALDDKIELNRRMNETLEEIARTLFKSWFIDFDPVRAKMAGRAPAGMDASTAALFPAHMDGAVPAGWCVRRYGEGLTVIKGKSYKSDELQPSSTALVTLKSFLRGGGYRDDGLKDYVGTCKPEQIVHPGELVVAFTDVTQAADVIGKPALVRASARFARLVASLDVGIVRSSAAELPIEYLYYRFLSSDFQEHAYAHSNGSTVLHLSSDAIAKYEGLWPSRACAGAFRRAVRPLLDLEDSNWTQISTLEALRDLLLPRLLSGKLRIRDAEREVGRVA
jgi:type I restriction enzyme, S subunit